MSEIAILYSVSANRAPAIQQTNKATIVAADHLGGLDCDFFIALTSFSILLIGTIYR